MSIIGRTFEEAIKKGQASTKASMEKLEELLGVIIENDEQLIKNRVRDV